jgi:hypothetical protein
MKKTNEMILSRNFVEFGPFTPEELSGFSGRGILLESDYVKEAGGHVWHPCMEWLASRNDSNHPKAPAPKISAKAPAKKPAARAKSA